MIFKNRYKLLSQNPLNPNQRTSLQFTNPNFFKLKIPKMWRSTTLRSNFTKKLGKKLISLQNPQLISSQSQVFNYNYFNSKSYCNYLLIRVNPRKFTHQNFRILSQFSTISEFDAENHEPNSASSESDVDNDTIDVNLSKDPSFRGESNGNDEIIDAQMNDSSSIDGLSSENSDAQILGFGSDEKIGDDFDGNVENNDGQVDEELVEGVSSETVIDVVKLEGVLALLNGSVDGSLENSLDELELSLNEEFMLRVIETPLVPEEHLVRFFKWGMSKKELTVDTKTVFGSLARVVGDKLIKKDIYVWWDLVKEVGQESGVVSVELLNQLLFVFGKMGKGNDAFEVFGKFDELGCVPNGATYYLTIGALCRGSRSRYDLAALVSEKMLDAGMIPDREKVSSIIYNFCKARRSKEAHAVYLAAKQKNIVPKQRPIIFLISCLSKVDETVPLALEMLADFSAEARKGAISPFSWVVRGLCRIKDIEGGKKLLLEMIEKGPPPGNDIFNIIINALSKTGELDDAKEILKLMESRGLKPDVFAYTAIISGYSKEGFMEEAREVLSEASKKHLKLCPVTLHTLIRGYCKLEQFDKAVELLSDMKKYGVEPNVDEYNKLIYSLCVKALDWETAEKLLEEMKTKGLHLPGITQGLIKAVKELKQEAAESEEAEPEAEANA